MALSAGGHYTPAVMDTTSAVPAAGRSTEAFVPFDVVDGDPASGLIIVCDHAENRLPAKYGDLGLPESEFSRHIAYDIGAGAVSRALAKSLGVPAVLSTFSRLLIDPNRGEDDPTLIMRISDRAVVLGNAGVDAAERAYRIANFHAPYHAAIDAAINRGMATGVPPVLLSIHSFTPAWAGKVRPWHAGILWDADPRMAVPLIEALREEPDLLVGDNEPYSGSLTNDTMYRHGTRRGLAHALLEIRQDLIADPEGVAEWAGRLAPIVVEIVQRPEMHEVLAVD
jgi:predicted N-formylglutamate amidohydrolase